MQSSHKSRYARLKSTAFFFQLDGEAFYLYSTIMEDRSSANSNNNHGASGNVVSPGGPSSVQARLPVASTTASSLTTSPILHSPIRCNPLGATWSSYSLPLCLATCSLMLHVNEEGALNQLEVEPRVCPPSIVDYGTILHQMKTHPHDALGGHIASFLVHSIRNQEATVSKVTLSEARELYRNLGTAESGSLDAAEETDDPVVLVCRCLLLIQQMTPQTLYVRLSVWSGKIKLRVLCETTLRDQADGFRKTKLHQDNHRMLNDLSPIRISSVEATTRVRSGCYALTADPGLLGLEDDLASPADLVSIADNLRSAQFPTTVTLFAPPGDSTDASSMTTKELAYAKQIGIWKQNNMENSRPLTLGDKLVHCIEMVAVDESQACPWKDHSIKQKLYVQSQCNSAATDIYSGALRVPTVPSTYKGLRSTMEESAVQVLKFYTLRIRSAVHRTKFVSGSVPGPLGETLKGKLSKAMATWATDDAVFSPITPEFFRRKCCEVVMYFAVMLPHCRRQRGDCTRQVLVAWLKCIADNPLFTQKANIEQYDQVAIPAMLVVGFYVPVQAILGAQEALEKESKSTNRDQWINPSRESALMGDLAKVYHSNMGGCCRLGGSRVSIASVCLHLGNAIRSGHMKMETRAVVSLVCRKLVYPKANLDDFLPRFTVVDAVSADPSHIPSPVSLSELISALNSNPHSAIANLLLEHPVLVQVATDGVAPDDNEEEDADPVLDGGDDDSEGDESPASDTDYPLPNDDGSVTDKAPAAGVAPEDNEEDDADPVQNGGDDGVEDEPNDPEDGKPPAKDPDDESTESESDDDDQDHDESPGIGKPPAKHKDDESTVSEADDDDLNNDESPGIVDAETQAKLASAFGIPAVVDEAGKGGNNLDGGSTPSSNPPDDDGSSATVMGGAAGEDPAEEVGDSGNILDDDGSSASVMGGATGEDPAEEVGDGGNVLDDDSSNLEDDSTTSSYRPTDDETPASVEASVKGDVVDEAAAPAKGPVRATVAVEATVAGKNKVPVVVETSAVGLRALFGQARSILTGELPNSHQRRKKKDKEDPPMDDRKRPAMEGAAAIGEKPPSKRRKNNQPVLHEKVAEFFAHMQSIVESLGTIEKQRKLLKMIGEHYGYNVDGDVHDALTDITVDIDSFEYKVGVDSQIADELHDIIADMYTMEHTEEVGELIKRAAQNLYEY